MLFLFILLSLPYFVGNHYWLALEICIHWSMTDPRCQHQILNSTLKQSFSSLILNAGVGHRSVVCMWPLTAVTEITQPPTLQLYSIQFPQASASHPVFCHLYAVSIDLWKIEKKKKKDHNSKPHFSAVKSDSWLSPVFTAASSVLKQLPLL